MHYKTGYCFTARDLFDTFNLKLLKIKRDTVQKKYGVHSKQDFCASVILYCFYLILLDIIENNVTFVLPTRSRESVIQVKPFFKEEFIRAYQNGKFDGIDFLQSNFSGYEIQLRYEYRGGFREKSVHINKKHKDRFYELINQGKKYY